jgi:iron complex outermembrane receptor protein
MNRNSKFQKVLFGGSSLLVLTIPQFSLAQTATASGSDLTLEEVVITAQKRVQRLEDVPVAATVVSGSSLAEQNIGSLSDLNQVVPSLSLGMPMNSKGSSGVRGVSSVSNQNAVGIVSGLAVLVDGVPVPSDSSAATQLEDVQRVEVLKGPQSTLGGRSAAQGVINIVTRAPSSVWTGTVAGTLTDDHEKRINGFVSGPLVSDKLDFSLAGYYNSRYYPITNAYYGTQTREKTEGVHAKLLFKPSDNLDITLAGVVSSGRTYGNNLTYIYVTPTTTFLGIPGFLTPAQLLPGITPSFENQTYNSPVNSAGSDVHDSSASLNIDYKLGEYTLSSTTAYQKDSQDTVNDLFAFSQYFFNVLTHGGGTFSNTQSLSRSGRQTSEELKLVSPEDQPFSYIVGLFFSDAPIRLSALRLFVQSPINYTVSETSTTYDLYARSTWKFSATNSLVTGLRYNYDKMSYSLNQIANGSAGAFNSSGSDNSSAIVGDISLQHQINDNWMVYGSYARGYAPEAYNTTATLTSNNSLKPVGQSKIDNFEIGSKGSYFDRRLILNVALFDTIYKHYQIQTYVSTPGSVVASLDLTSAGQVSTRGIEVDATLSATRDLRLNWSVAYINAKFDNFKNAPCYSYARTPPAGCAVVNGQSVQDVSGDPMPNSPKFKTTLGAEQRIPLTAIPYDVVVTGRYAYQTSTQMLYDQNPQAVLPSFGILDLSLGLAENTGKYTATVFVNNVFDHHYPVFVADFWNSVWVSNAVVGQPARDSSRYLGIRLSAAF